MIELESIIVFDLRLTVWNMFDQACPSHCPATMEDGTLPQPKPITEREFISLLIELYRAQPELWKVKSKDYFNRTKKQMALEKILNALRTVKPNYTLDELKKKINCLRTNFNREYKAIESKKKSGAGVDEIPVPSLWYYNDFNHLLFLFFLRAIATIAMASIASS